METYPEGSAGSRYSQLEHFRDPFLQRARECAKVTIPSLLPPEGHTFNSILPTPWQGLGARGLNNLASKLLLAILPPNSPFFRFKVDEYLVEQLAEAPEARTEIEEALGKMERAIMDEIETTAIRVSVFEALKQLLMAGNVLLYVAPKGGVRVFRLDRFVAKRDPMGNVLEIVTKEDVAPNTLPKNVQELISGDLTQDEKTCALFTHVKRVDDKWEVYQEIKGKRVPDSYGTYPLDKTPWIVLRFTKIDGEDYGRGYCEEYLGDLLALEGLTKAIVEAAAAAAKVLILVDPNGTTDQKTLAEAPNGSIKPGKADDVSVVQLEKYHDFRTAMETIEQINQRLAFAFLMNTAIQRNGERVTAEEIRYMAGELEDALGGVYSILSQEFQLPLVNRLMAQMQKQKRLPTLPKGTVRPSIVTGLEALGRGHDLNKLDVFISGALQTLGPEIVGQYLNVGDYLKRRATALGIETKGLVKTPEEIAQEQERAMMGQLVDRLGPNAVNVLGKQMELANGAGKPGQE